MAAMPFLVRVVQRTGGAIFRVSFGVFWLAIALVGFFALRGAIADKARDFAALWYEPATATVLNTKLVAEERKTIVPQTWGAYYSSYEQPVLLVEFSYEVGGEQHASMLRAPEYESSCSPALFKTGRASGDTFTVFYDAEDPTRWAREQGPRWMCFLFLFVPGLLFAFAVDIALVLFGLGLLFSWGDDDETEGARNANARQHRPG